MFGLKFSSESKLFGGCHLCSHATSATLSLSYPPRLSALDDIRPKKTSNTVTSQTYHTLTCNLPERHPVAVCMVGGPLQILRVCISFKFWQRMRTPPIILMNLNYKPELQPNLNNGLMLKPR